MTLTNINDSIWEPVQILVRCSALISIENAVYRPVWGSVLFSVRDYIGVYNFVWWGSDIRKRYESN
jgi:hypothetical protein